mmetsp:Transcript_24956/g.51302  ORF Transcript_24956/g.51302 Transcript_24956/m.51302 type:complete len:219 (+) Transcript_24956:470-1126(+)
MRSLPSSSVGRMLLKSLASILQSSKSCNCCSRMSMSTSGCASFKAFSTKVLVTMFHTEMKTKATYARYKFGNSCPVFFNAWYGSFQSTPEVDDWNRVTTVRKTLRKYVKTYSSASGDIVVRCSIRYCTIPCCSRSPKTYITKTSIITHHMALMREPSTQSNIRRSSLKNFSVRKTRRIFTILHRRIKRKKPKFTLDELPSAEPEPSVDAAAAAIGSRS